MRINKIINKNIFAAVIFLGVSLTSCEKDLDRMPQTEVTSADIYKDFANYKSVLAKCYAGLAVSGQSSGDGNPDILGIDGGASNYLRQFFQMQELTTDEAIIAWNDGSLPDLHNMTWSPSNEFITAIYYRIFYQIAVTNEFIRETSDAKLAERNITGADAETARLYRNEARFLRALSYSHAMDLFGNVPFVTENDQVGVTPPQRILRKDLFVYIENELKALEGVLKDPRTNDYARADKAAAWMLMAKNYLNAEVYTGTARYNDARIYSEKVINSGFTLKQNYNELFLADNNLQNNEVIFPVALDGIKTRTYGGTTYIIHAGVGGSMVASEFGINGGWGGLRTTKNLVQKFPDANGVGDKRGRFHTAGQNINIQNFGNFTEGYPLIKYKNVKRDGTAGSDAGGDFVDTDFPMFRLADAYLMYAEAHLRGGGGSLSNALQYVNLLRTRAQATPVTSLDLNFILDERSRELSWEATRRTDLIRFGKFTTADYLWPFKGGAVDGQAVGVHRNLFPIPTNDLVTNPNLMQNPGY